jgi:Xaa-Pro aminopeptidase
MIEYFNERIRKLRAIMKEKGLDVVMVTKPENAYYMSGFNPILNSHPVYVIVPIDQDPCLLVHSLRYNHAKEEAAMQNVTTYGKWGDNTGLTMDPVDAIKEIISGVSGINKRIGSDIAYLSVGNSVRITKALEIESFIDVSDDFSHLKMVKDNLEVDLLRKSAAIADYGMEQMILSLSNGLSEAEACTEAQYAMRQLWQKDYSEYEISGFGSPEGGVIDAMHSWCLTGKRISYGCDCPIKYVPKENEFIKTFIWSKLAGYHIENERTIFVRKIDEYKSKALQAVLEARQNVFSAIKPGVTFEALYLEAIKVLKAYGFDGMLPGRIGHGIGLSAHEFPSLKAGNNIQLESGMVFTVEPGLYSTEWGGVAHSDTIVVTESGCEILTKSVRKIITI